jgi:group I intron endonuclease
MINNNKIKYSFKMRYASINNYSIKINPNKNEVDPIIENFLIDKNLGSRFIYDNLGNIITKKKLMSDTKYLSGIYLILNKVTLDYYIGSASTGKFYSRFSNHLFNFNGSKILKNAVKKDNISSFAFIILELYPEMITKENNKNLLDLEDFYLKSLLPNYNILTEAGTSFGYKHTEITRIKMKACYSEERRRTIGNLNKGKRLAESTVNIIREKALKREKINYTLQVLANIKKKAKPVLVYNLDYTVYGEYTSITETAKSLNCAVKTVFRALKSEKKLLKNRWIVKYI